MDRKIGIIVVVLVLGVIFADEPMILSAQIADQTNMTQTEQLQNKSSVSITEQTTNTQTEKVQIQGPVQTTEHITDTQIENLRDDLRREYLDNRDKSIDRWLVILGLVIAFFGIVIPIVIAVITIFNLRKFRNLEIKAQGIVDKVESDAKKFKDEVRQILDNMRKEEQTIREHSDRLKDLSDRSSADIRSITEDATETISDPKEEFEEKVPEDLRISRASFLNNKDVIEAQALQQNGRFEEAIEKWHSIANSIVGNDSDLEACVWIFVGNLYLRKHAENQTISNLDKAQALAALDKAIELKTDLAEAYHLRGLVKFTLDADQEAILDHDKAIQLEPNNAKFHHARGLVKYFDGKYQDALNDLSQTIHLKPDNVSAYVLQGDANNDLNRYNDALENYEKAIDLDPYCAEAYYGRANVKVSLSQYESAIADYDKAIDLKIDRAKPYALRGTLKVSQGRIDEAKLDFQTALKLAEQQGPIELKFYMEEQLRELNNPTSQTDET